MAALDQRHLRRSASKREGFAVERERQVIGVAGDCYADRLAHRRDIGVERIDAAGDRVGDARAADDTGGRCKLALSGAGQEPFATRRLAQVSKIDLAGLDAGRAQPNSSRIAVAEPMTALVLKGAEHSRGYAL